MSSDNAYNEPAFVIARNPLPDTRLPYLLYLPVAGEDPLILATSKTWPTVKDVYCHQLEEWPEQLDVLETVPVQACWRAGKSVHLVLKRRLQHRALFIWAQKNGRTLIFWRTQKTMQAARPGIRVPAARGLERCQIPIAVDHRERYPWKFPRQHACTEQRELPVGDYGIFFGNNLVVAVERKSIADLAGAISSGILRMQLAELSRLPRGMLIVEGRLSDLVKAEKAAGISSGWLLNLVAALQAEYPNIQWLFAETRSIAQDIAYRWLSASVVILKGEIGAKSGLEPPGFDRERTDAGDPGAATVAEVPDIWQSGASGAGPVRVTDRLGRQREALMLARQGWAWTSGKYQGYFQVSAATACNDIKALVEKGELVLAGRGRPHRYIAPDATEPAPEA